MAQDVRRRVYLYFQFWNGWQCQFLEQDLKTPLPPKLHFNSLDRITGPIWPPFGVLILFCVVGGVVLGIGMIWGCATVDKMRVWSRVLWLVLPGRCRTATAAARPALRLEGTPAFQRFPFCS